MPATKANGWKEDDCLGGPCASPDECCIPCCCLCFRDACAEINGKGIAVQSDGEDGGGDEEGGNDEGNEGDCCGVEGKVEDYAKRIIIAFVTVPIIVLIMLLMLCVIAANEYFGWGGRTPILNVTNTVCSPVSLCDSLPSETCRSDEDGSAPSLPPSAVLYFDEWTDCRNNQCIFVNTPMVGCNETKVEVGKGARSPSLLWRYIFIEFLWALGILVARKVILLGRKGKLLCCYCRAEPKWFSWCLPWTLGVFLYALVLSVSMMISPGASEATRGAMAGILCAIVLFLCIYCRPWRRKARPPLAVQDQRPPHSENAPRHAGVGGVALGSHPPTQSQRPDETIVKVIRPLDVRPGDKIDVSTPLGHVRCTVPEGVAIGGAFHVTAPL